jgi:hypothetical protein
LVRLWQLTVHLPKQVKSEVRLLKSKDEKLQAQILVLETRVISKKDSSWEDFLDKINLVKEERDDKHFSLI